MQNKSNTQQNTTEDNKNLSKPQNNGDLDDFIFGDEFIKYQSER